MKSWRIIIAMTAAVLSLTSCSSEPEYADPEAHEKSVQLKEQYEPLVIGTWHYEKIGDSQRYYEELTFHADGTLTGMRKWESRKMVAIDGEQRYSDWEDVGLSGTFTGSWSLKYWSPEGQEGKKRNCLQLYAVYDNEEQNYMAYSSVADFGYADATTLRIQGYYVKDSDGWINYRRGEAEPSF